MKPLFAVQITHRHDEDLKLTVDALEADGLDWINYGMIPFTDEITNLDAFPTDRLVVPLGGTKLVDMYLRGKLPGNWRVCYSHQHFDQLYSAGIYGEEMLNLQYSSTIRYDNVRSQVFDRDVFIKPTNDLKAFAGMILPMGKTLDQALAEQTHQPIADDQSILVSKVKQLGREFRLFIVDGELIDASEYRNRGVVKAKTVSPQDGGVLYDYFQAVKKPDAPALYCMDVAEVFEEHGHDLRIVELNCFHASGMYTVDRGMVLHEVAAYIERG